MQPQRAAEPPDAAGEAVATTGAPLVTGGGGFAGEHLVRRLAADGRSPVAPPRTELDLLDAEAVRAALRELRPATVFHLAAFSSPRRSWECPHEAVLDNLRMTLNLLEGARAEAPQTTLVLVGSGQVYGAPATLPLTESAALAPGNPYGASKAACDMLGRQYAESFGMRVVCLRPFNHAGPGQSDEYVLSTLARQVAEAERARAPQATIRTGDAAVARDFTDVRDVARAYAMAADAEPGAYNVCSGRATRIERLIELLSAQARVAVRHEVDPQRLRPQEIREVFGSHERLTTATGWRPEIPLEQTVRDTLGWWRERLR